MYRGNSYIGCEPPPRENENYKNKSENLENNLIYKHTSLKTELNVLYTNADGLSNKGDELKIVLNSAKVRLT